MDSLATVNVDAAELVDVEGREVFQQRDPHRIMLWISVAILVAAFLLRERATGRVGLAFLPQWNLPTLCGSRALLGVECPGCGLTRSFVALAGGDWRGSLAANRVGWLIALAVLLQIPYRSYSLYELRASRGGQIPARTWPIWCGYLLIAALVVNWLLRVSGIY